MHPFEVTMIVSATSLILITALLLIIRTMPSREGVGWWTCAAALQSFAYILQLLFHDQEKSVTNELIFFLLQTTVNSVMVIGTLLFIQHKVDPRLWIGVPVLMLASTVDLSLAGLSSISVLLFALYSGGAFLFLAYAIFKSPEPINKSTKIMGVLSVIVGFHWLDYPLLGHIEWFAPIGFILGMTLALGIFLSLSAMALTQFREQTLLSEERAIYTAEHDALTGLYNRSCLSKLFDEYVKEAEQNNLPFLVLYLDLDGFKAVNDKFGHKAGDMLLITVANRLEKWLGDRGDAIRIGGDEIIVLSRLRRAYSEESAYKSARLLLDMIEFPIVDGKNVHRISSSIGGCSYQPNILIPTLDEMIGCADKKMYISKQAGGHCITLKKTYESDCDQDDNVRQLKPMRKSKHRAKSRDIKQAAPA